MNFGDFSESEFDHCQRDSWEAFFILGRLFYECFPPFPSILLNQENRCFLHPYDTSLLHFLQQRFGFGRCH